MLSWAVGRMLYLALASREEKHPFIAGFNPNIFFRYVKALQYRMFYPALYRDVLGNLLFLATSRKIDGRLHSVDHLCSLFKCFLNCQFYNIFITFKMFVWPGWPGQGLAPPCYE